VWAGEADQEAIDEHTIDAYELADRNSNHQDRRSPSCPAGSWMTSPRWRTRTGRSRPGKAMTAAGTFVLTAAGTCIDAGHLDPIDQ
jgi:hypothetical protein